MFFVVNAPFVVGSHCSCCHVECMSRCIRNYFFCSKTLGGVLAKSCGVAARTEFASTGCGCSILSILSQNSPMDERYGF